MHLKQASSFINADDWTHAINKEFKQTGAEQVHSAVTVLVCECVCG